MSGTMEKIKETFTGSSTTGATTGGSSGQGVYVIKTFQPHTGKATELENVLKTHWESLHAAGLTTDQRPLFVMSKTGQQFLEIFEWKDKACIDRAHEIDSLKGSWNLITSLADLVPLSSLEESSDPYAHFQLFDPSQHQGLSTYVNIVIMRPHQGQESEVISNLGEHYKQLCKMGLVTQRMPMRGRAKSQGQIIEVIEWKSREGPAEAKKSDPISSIWSSFHNIADTQLIQDWPEAKDRYTLFDALSVQ